MTYGLKRTPAGVLAETQEEAIQQWVGLGTRVSYLLQPCGEYGYDPEVGVAPAVAGALNVPLVQLPAPVALRLALVADLVEAVALSDAKTVPESVYKAYDRWRGLQRSEEGVISAMGRNREASEAFAGIAGEEGFDSSSPRYRAAHRELTASADTVQAAYEAHQALQKGFYAELGLGMDSAEAGPDEQSG